MRACACVTAFRLCVRTVFCSSAFLFVPSSPSTGSAADRSALFASFAGTIDESDFFAPYIIGYGLRPSRCGPGDGFPRAGLSWLMKNQQAAKRRQLKRHLKVDG